MAPPMKVTHKPGLKGVGFKPMPAPRKKPTPHKKPGAKGVPGTPPFQPMPPRPGPGDPTRPVKGPEPARFAQLPNLKGKKPVKAPGKKGIGPVKRS